MAKAKCNSFISGIRVKSSASEDWYEADRYFSAATGNPTSTWKTSKPFSQWAVNRGGQVRLAFAIARADYSLAGSTTEKVLMKITINNIVRRSQTLPYTEVCNLPAAWGVTCATVYPESGYGSGLATLVGENCYKGLSTDVLLIDESISSFTAAFTVVTIKEDGTEIGSQNDTHTISFRVTGVNNNPSTVTDEDLSDNFNTGGNQYVNPGKIEDDPNQLIPGVPNWVIYLGVGFASVAVLAIILQTIRR